MKPANNSIQQKLYQVIDESLALLKQSSISEQTPTKLDIPIPSLLDQCLELCEQHQQQSQESLRTIHHFGLPLDSPLLSSLATIANTRVLTDIHPNNNSFKDSIKSQILVAKNITTNKQTVSSLEKDKYRFRIFLNDLQQIQQQSNQIGQRLLICDNHCLSQIGKTHTADLLTLLNRQFAVRSLIVVTDPVDSYPAYCTQTQVNIPPLSFEEYCQSILNFIQAHSNLTVIRHEDFIAEPESVMGEFCEVLDLTVCEDFLVLGTVFRTENIDKKNNQNVRNFYQFKTVTKKSYQKICDLFNYYKINPIENKKKIKYLSLINDKQFLKRQTIRLSNETTQIILSKKIKWFTLSVQAGFEYHLKGIIDSNTMSKNHAIALFKFLDAEEQIIENESIFLPHADVGYYQYIKINKTGLADFFLSFLVPDLCFSLKIGFRTWGKHNEVITMNSDFNIEINTNLWLVAHDDTEYNDAVATYKNAYQYIDENDFINAIKRFKKAEKLAPQLKFPYTLLRHYKWVNEENISCLNAKNKFENTWAISEQLFFTILDILPVGSTILELGSGTGTKELCKYYKVISIEHNQKWLNRSDAEYIYAPLVNDFWYDSSIIAKALENKSYDLLLIDGPPQFRRAGIVDNFYLFKSDVPIIFDDISRNEDAYAMNRLAEKLEKRPEVYIMSTKGYALIR